MNTHQFTTYYKLKYRGIFKYVYERIPKYEDIEDIVSESFLALWNSRNNLSTNNIDGYLFRIVRNKINDKLREKYKIDIKNTQYNEDIEIEEIDKSEKIIKQDNNYIKEYINSLKEKEQTIITLKYYENKSNKEIANRLNTTINNIKVIHNRIIKKLKLKIQNK